MIIGIDVGLNYSGVAIIDKDKLINLLYLDFFDLINLINENKKCIYVVENSNLKKQNWHGHTARENVGKNKAVCTLLLLYFKKNNIRYIEVAPQGFSIVAKNKKIFESDSKYNGRSNEHNRAAYFMAKSVRL